MNKRKQTLKNLWEFGITDVNVLSERMCVSKNRTYELIKEMKNAGELKDDEKVVENREAPVEPVKTEPTTKKPVDKNFVPEQTKRKYVSRNIQDTTDMNILKKMYDLRRPLLIIGDTGCGKTHSVNHFCTTNKLPYCRVNVNGSTTPEEMLGQFVPNGDGTFHWIDGVLTHFVRNGGVFVVDEINSGNAEILFFLHPLLDDERRIVLGQKDGEVLHAHPDFWLVATMNPDYEGTKPLNLALKDRFEVIEYDYDAGVERKLVENKNLLDFANKVRAMYVKREIETPLSTRSLINYEENVRIFGEKIAETFLLNKFSTQERTAVEEVFKLLVKKPARATTKDNVNPSA